LFSTSILLLACATQMTNRTQEQNVAWCQSNFQMPIYPGAQARPVPAENGQYQCTQATGDDFKKVNEWLLAEFAKPERNRWEISRMKERHANLETYQLTDVDHLVGASIYRDEKSNLTFVHYWNLPGNWKTEDGAYELIRQSAQSSKSE
jgi:hypothetical protein